MRRQHGESASQDAEHKALASPTKRQQLAPRVTPAAAAAATATPTKPQDRQAAAQNAVPSTQPARTPTTVFDRLILTSKTGAAKGAAPASPDSFTIPPSSFGGEPIPRAAAPEPWADAARFSGRERMLQYHREEEEEQQQQQLQQPQPQPEEAAPLPPALPAADAAAEGQAGEAQAAAVEGGAAEEQEPQEEEQERGEQPPPPPQQQQQQRQPRLAFMEAMFPGGDFPPGETVSQLAKPLGSSENEIWQLHREDVQRRQEQAAEDEANWGSLLNQFSE